jgi:hypothetical protein
MISSGPTEGVNASATSLSSRNQRACRKVAPSSMPAHRAWRTRPRSPLGYDHIRSSPVFIGHTFHGHPMIGRCDPGSAREDVRREAGQRQEPADVGDGDALLLGKVGDRLRLTALDPPPPAMRSNQRLDQGLVSASTSAAPSGVMISFRPPRRYRRIGMRMVTVLPPAAP